MNCIDAWAWPGRDEVFSTNILRRDVSATCCCFVNGLPVGGRTM